MNRAPPIPSPQRGPASPRPRSHLTRHRTIPLLLISVLGISGFFLLSYDQAPPYEGGALIIDTLSSWEYGSPIPDQIIEAISSSGLAVHYYEKVDTNILRHLPARGYKLILLRVHSNIGAFTVDETYSGTRYLIDQLLGRVGVFVPEGGGEKSFGVTGEFIAKSMRGRFEDTIVVLMGCRGLQQTLAGPFLQRGARAFIGWTSMVTLPYTDTATALFLQKFLVEDKPLKVAIDETMSEIVLDPEYGARLGFYPRREAELRADQVMS